VPVKTPLMKPQLYYLHWKNHTFFAGNYVCKDKKRLVNFYKEIVGYTEQSWFTDCPPFMDIDEFSIKSFCMTDDYKLKHLRDLDKRDLATFLYNALSEASKHNFRTIQVDNEFLELSKKIVYRYKIKVIVVNKAPIIDDNKQVVMKLERRRLIHRWKVIGNVIGKLILSIKRIRTAFRCARLKKIEQEHKLIHIISHWKVHALFKKRVNKLILNKLRLLRFRIQQRMGLLVESKHKSRSISNFGYRTKGLLFEWKKKFPEILKTMKYSVKNAGKSINSTITSFSLSIVRWLYTCENLSKKGKPIDWNRMIPKLLWTKDDLFMTIQRNVLFLSELEIENHRRSIEKMDNYVKHTKGNYTRNESHNKKPGNTWFVGEHGSYCFKSYDEFSH